MVPLALAVIACGCVSQPNYGVVGSPPKVLAKAEKLYREGDTNAAIEVLSKALESRKYAQQRRWLFDDLLSLLLAVDRADEAKARYMEALGKDDELARGGFDEMYQYYLSLNDSVQLAEWTKAVVESELPVDLAETAYICHFKAMLATGGYQDIAARVPVCVAKLGGAASARILKPTVAEVINAGKYEDAGQMLKAIGNEAGQSIDLQRLALETRFDLYVAQGKWNEAENSFKRFMLIAAERDLARSLASGVSRAIQKGELERADKLCRIVLNNKSAKDAPRNEAAVQSVAVAKKRGGIAAVPGCLDSLLLDGISKETVLHLYANEFYVITQDGNARNISRMVEIGNKLSSALTNEDDLTAIGTMLLNAHFILEDYRGALRVLEAGVPGRAKEWVEMAKIKINAHLALKSGKKAEAVVLFRKFMDGVKLNGKSELDPETGVTHTKEMCLGLNAKRIGDILASMGAAKESAGAYEEALAYYRKALDDFPSDTKEYAIVKKEMADVPVKRRP